MPPITLIIPTYNNEACLHLCIQSVLKQTFTDFELLLIDDGSTDHSGEICDQYARQDPRIRVLHQTNGGPSTARNRGIEEAKGEYISFLDNDDSVEAHYLATLLERPEITDLTFFGSTFHDTDNGTSKDWVPLEKTFHGFHEVQKGIIEMKTNQRHPDYLGFIWNKLFKREIIMKHSIRFLTGLSLREDEVFTLEYAARCTSLSFIPQILHHYIISHNSLTYQEHLYSDFVVLTEGFQGCRSLYTHPQLLELIDQWVADYSMKAVKKASSNKERNVALNKLFGYHHLYGCGLNIKQPYRFLLRQSSSKALVLYFYAREFFKQFIQRTSKVQKQD